MHSRKSADTLTSITPLLTFLRLAVIALSRLLYPYDAGCYEANIWAPASLLRSGANPYNIEHARWSPHIASTYAVGISAPLRHGGVVQRMLSAAAG